MGCSARGLAGSATGAMAVSTGGSRPGENLTKIGGGLTTPAAAGGSKTTGTLSAGAGLGNSVAAVIASGTVSATGSTSAGSLCVNTVSPGTTGDAGRSTGS